jgi:hypothetical protein
MEPWKNYRLAILPVQRQVGALAKITIFFFGIFGQIIAFFRRGVRSKIPSHLLREGEG